MTTTEIKIIIEDGYCYPSFPIHDNGDIFVCLRFTEPDLPEHTCKYTQVRRINIQSQTAKWIFYLKDDGDYITSKPILHTDKYLFTTNNYIIALNKNNGNVVWQVKLKLWTTNINVIDNLIYLCNDKEIKILNCENGKTIKSKKYKVKWLDSSVVENNNRLFVSTASSKIIEINIETLEVENEFKYPGRWAIASTPSFFNNLMLSNSYSAYVSCFDLSTNETLWKVKKQTGTEPKQLIDSKNDLFFVIEILQEYRLTEFMIKNGKKKWVRNYHIHDLQNLNDNLLIGLLKNSVGQYFVGIINKQSGEIVKEKHLSEYVYDERFQYRLWKGAELTIDDKQIVLTYSPNEIYILDKNNIA